MLCTFFSFKKSDAQSRLLKGQVFAAVSRQSTADILVESSNGASTFTDNNGFFSLQVNPHDSIYFYIDRLIKSIPYKVDSIQNFDNYAITIQKIKTDIANAKIYGQPVENLDPKLSLENVTVVAKNYHKDSLENRESYDKIFNYKRPPINPFSPVQTVYDLLSFKKKKRMKRMKGDLLFDEQQGYIDTRFNRTSVLKSLGKEVDDSTLDKYMKKYRPTYEEAVGMENLAMIMYIRKTFEIFMKDPIKEPEHNIAPVINKK